jgi:dTDP-4-dehydrorhamnose 3,5-epimerase-like enzyme
MKPELLTGGKHSDSRGIICYNNDFDSSFVRRIYVIENYDTSFIRGWQGHKVEQRWFSAMQGSFKIQLIKVDNWECPSKKLDSDSYVIDAEQLNVLHIPQGYISSIQSLSKGSKLLVMSDYRLNEINDEYRFPLDYFE